MSIDLIQNLGGVWSRPFVTDGDPYKVNGAIIGLNPATPIPTTYASRDDLYRLVKDRQKFESCYERYRKKIGKIRGKSPTRMRLGIIIAALPSFNFTETNVNAYPIGNSKQLERSPYKANGGKIAETYLRQIQPKIVIIHSFDALAAMQELDFFSLGNKLTDFHMFTKFYDDAHWNGSPTHTFSIPALAARTEGWSNDMIRKIVTKIQEFACGELGNEKGVVEAVDASSNMVRGMSDSSKAFRSSSWLDCEVEAIRNEPNRFLHNSKRWMRHELLLENGKRLKIREYNRLLVARKLRGVSKKYILKGINNNNIRFFDEDGRPLLGGPV